MIEAKPDAPASRKKGRPRTVTDDEQPPDRRRKQLRMAQQAYRRRKETMITSLQTRVQELESGIEDLSESFLSFSHLLLEADDLRKSPRITSALHKITQQCVSLARRGCDEPGLNSAAGTILNTSRKPSTTQNVNPNYHPVVEQTNTSAINGETVESLHATQDQSPASRSPPKPPYQDRTILPFGIVSSSPTIPFSSVSRPSLACPPAMISPSGAVNGVRWTLSRRLVRECCGNGYRLLINSSANDAKVQAIFGNHMDTSERSHMLSRLYAAMNGELGDMIELSTKALSPIQPMRNTYWPGQLATSTKMWLIDAEHGSEEWLDANAVQKFLLEKGIQVLGTSSPEANPRSTSSSQLNVMGFISLLSLNPVCVGRGPAFRKRDVENAFHLAALGDPWPFDVSPPTLHNEYQ